MSCSSSSYSCSDNTGVATGVYVAAVIAVILVKVCICFCIYKCYQDKKKREQEFIQQQMAMQPQVVVTTVPMGTTDGAVVPTYEYKDANTGAPGTPVTQLQAGQPQPLGVYGQPTYGQPTYGQPTYAQPAAPQQAYIAPTYST